MLLVSKPNYTLTHISICFQYYVSLKVYLLLRISGIQTQIVRDWVECAPSQHPKLPLKVRRLFFSNVCLWSRWRFKGVCEVCVAGDRGLVVAWRLVLLLFGLRSMFALTRCTRLTRCRPAGRETTPDFFCIKQLWAESHILTVYIYYTHTHPQTHQTAKYNQGCAHSEADENMCTHTSRTPN